MSFTSDYLEAEKKRKKKTGDPFTDEYLALEEERREKERAERAERASLMEKDIAPIATTSKEDGPWVKAGAFEDGYQFGDIIKTVGATSRDLMTNIYAGAAGIAESTIDAAAYIVGGAAGLFGADDVKKSTEDFIKQDIIDEQAVGRVLSAINGGLGTDIIVGDADAVNHYSVLGDKTDSLVQSGGQLVGQIGLQAVGVPWYVTTGATSFGSGAEGALNEGATMEQAGLSAAITMGADILTEKLFGGSGLGEKGLINLDGLTKGISNKAVKALADYGVDITAEGFEEVGASVISKLGDALYKEESLDELLLSEEAVDEYIDSFIGGAVLGGVANAGKMGNSVKTGRDYRTGLTSDEQAVFDKVYNDRIAEAKTDGKKLTGKEKSKIYDDVMDDMEKGRIDTDTIESVLGGLNYKAYRDTVDSEDSLIKEYEELGKKQNATLAEQSRYAELEAQIKDIKDNSKRNELKSKLGESVYGRAKDTKLAESYHERARRGQAFTADTSKYNKKQQAVIQNAIDSGILNNTRRTHEFVDMVAKLSADKGVSFNFADNAKLKESGFAIEGATINGFVTKDGITVNIDSGKSLNTVVGHEITHVLEGTELYKELQTAIKAYAETKGDYKGRYDSLAKLYEGVEGADIDAEITADLVGDYLFTDKDFIANLSTKNRNLFQKLWDEVKYLYKIATAGSKEKRQLEVVKRAFEDAYKADTKASTDTKYSISDKNIKDVSTGYASGESYYTMSYTQDGKVVGTLEYGEYDGAPNVKMIEVDPDYRRKGIATKLLQELQNKYPDTEIDFGMSTPDGTKLLDAITYDVTDEAIVADRQKLKDLQTELNDLQGKLDVLFDTENLTEAQENELHDLGDRWQEVYETIGKMEKELRGKRATKTFVKTDTKYSLTDSDGKKLTNEQSEYFKDSKMRDENGALKVMYHGSQDAGFHTFDAKFSDDDTSFFFVDRNDVATTYSGTSETYAPKAFKTAEDANKFFAEIGKTEYEVIERDGEYTLLDDGDEVATSDDLSEIYDEWRDWEGAGYGDANYKVYLNLTNPLVIDGKGRPWNKIDAEFSQEVYDKYSSLTAEEKAALTDLAEWEDFSLFNSEIQEATEGELASAYAKMGEDFNIYDLFSVAADGFSEDSMRENARKYLKTRDFAQRAKEGGYDGVIFNNIIDNGGYSNGSEGASTVAIAFSSEQIKSVANEKPTGDPDIRYSLSEDSKGRELSPAVKNRFANSKVIDENGSLKVVYHGTYAGEFSIFDKSKGSVEGDFGSGFYFTSDEYDVSRNYEDGGPDFENKVARRAEQIEQEEEIDYDEAEEKARNELYRGGHKFEVYLNIENPAIVGETMLFTDETYLDEYDPDDYDSEDDYYGDVEQLLVDDIDGIIWDIDRNIDIYSTEGIANVLFEAYSEGGIGIAELKNRINDLYLEDNNGNMVGNEVTRQIIESLGYDGIIDNTVSDKFKNMGLSPDTTHYIVFKPNQIKAVTNANPTDNPDIHRSLSADGEAPRQYGNYNVRGEDVRLEAPITENVARVQDSVQDAVQDSAENLQEVVPTAEDMAEVLPSDPDLSELYAERDALVKQFDTAQSQAEMDELAVKVNEISMRIERMEAEQTAIRREGFDSLTDEDAPPEAEAPFYGAERESGTIGRAAAEKIASNVADSIGLDAEDSTKMAQIIQKYAQDGSLTEEDLFEDIRRNFQYSEEIELGDDRISGAKKHIRRTKIYVPERLRAEFNGKSRDGYNAFRREHFGHFYLTSDKTALKIDELYGELNGLYPELFPSDLDTTADQLAKMGEVASMPTQSEIRVGEYDSDTINEVVDTIRAGIAEYYESEALRYAEEDRQNILNYHGVADIAPIAEQYEAITPNTYNTAKASEVKGQQAMFPDTEPRMKRATSEDIAPESAEPPKVAKVLESTPKEQKKVSLARKVRELLVDKQSSIEDLSLKTKNRELMGKADFMLRSESRAQRHIKNKLMPILEKVEATGNRQAFEEYAYHLHNIDRMSIESNAQQRIAALQGKFGHLKTEQIKAIAAKEITDKTTERTAATIREAKEYLNALEAKNLPVFGDTVTADVSREAVKRFEAKNPGARELADALVEYNNELRQILVDGNVVSQETADLWAKKYPHYVPIRRAGKDGAAVNVALDTKRTGVDAPIKRATGGNSDMESLLDTMASRTEQVFRAIARNNFGLELMHTLDTVVDTKPTSIDEILDTFDEGYDELLKKGENGANPTFTVFENGKRVTFDITEELYDALKPTNELFKTDVPIMSQLTKIQRGLLTQYNPTFVATNAIKDIQDVIVNSQHPAATYANVPLAAKELFNSIVRGKDGKWVSEYMDNGGEDLTYFDSRKKVFKKEDGAVKKVLGFAPGKIAQANDFVEKIPRLAEYIASRKKGASVEVAMLDAARVTTNFAAGGDLTKFANRNGFTFLNASVQGAAQQVRNIREAKANGLKGTMQLAAKFAVAALPAMLLNHLRWDDDEDYEELSDYVKDNYYIVAKTEDGKFIRIPKGRTVAVIQSGFEQMKNLVTGDDEVDMARFGQLMVENLAPNNPLDNNVLAPLAQAYNNKTWYGGDLVPTRLQDMPEAEQYDETTNSISKWLGENVGGSPYKWNYVIDQYSGGVGDVVLPMLTPESDGDGLLAPWSDKFTTDSTMKNQNVSDFYDTVDELTKNANSMHATDKDTLSSKYMNSVRTEIGELYAQKREVQNSDLSDAEKDEAVREIQEQINSLARESLATYGDVRIDGVYATVGDRHYRWYEPGEDSEAEAGWQKLTDDQLEKQEEVTSGLGISASEYWSDKSEYDFAYEYPEKYKFLNENGVTYDDYANGDEDFKSAWTWASKNPGKYTLSKAVSDDFLEFYGYKSVMNDFDAKDSNGETVSGLKKERVTEYINSLDLDYGQRIILYRSMYDSKEDRANYNMDIVDYLNSRDDISYDEMVTILKELGFDVDSEGNISWD